jgi:DNA-binding protein HU-beta
MAKSLTKSATIAKVAEMAGKALGADLSKKQVAGVIDALVGLAYKEAKNKFTLPGLGKLELKNRKARKGRNPKTGEEIDIPAKRVVKFRVAKAAKDAILGGK